MVSKRRYEAYNDEFYHSKEWRKMRLKALKRDNFLCQECLKNGIVRPANTVHHKTPLRNDKKQALKLSNLETVCTACHNLLHPERSKSKQAKEVKSYTKIGKDIIAINPNNFTV